MSPGLCAKIDDNNCGEDKDNKRVWLPDDFLILQFPLIYSIPEGKQEIFSMIRWVEVNIRTINKHVFTIITIIVPISYLTTDITGWGGVQNILFGLRWQLQLVILI